MCLSEENEEWKRKIFNEFSGVKARRTIVKGCKKKKDNVGIYRTIIKGCLR